MTSHRMRRVCFTLITCAIAFVCTAATPSATHNAAFDQWVNAFAADWMRANPTQATSSQYFTGTEQDALDRKFTPVTKPFRVQRVAAARLAIEELARFSPESLDSDQRVSASVLKWQLENVVNAQPFEDYRFVFEQFGGLQLHIVNFLTQQHPIRNTRDIENYLARLELVAGQIDDGIALAKERAAKGFVPPRFILTATIGQFDRFLEAKPDRNVLVTSLDQRAARLKNVSTEQRAAFVATAQKLVAGSIIPAFTRARTMLNEQLPAATDDAGIGHFPGGDKAYAQALHELTATDYTPAQIHELGLKEVARIEAEMDGYFKQLGYVEGPIAQRMARLESDSQPPANPDPRPALITRYEQILGDAEKRSARLFDLRPKAPCVVKREPVLSEKNAAAHYSPPAPDGTLPGVFWAPLPGPQFAIANMRTLVYHEAIPGHHFQLAIQGELTGLPRFRRDRVFGIISAFNEGWALYAEHLAAESGWYEGDPKGRLGQLNAELFRARRLVVDTGIHSMGWTRQQALDYGLPIDNPVAEVERYVVWPGQACSYKIGMLRILQARARAQKALGPKFSLKEFHNTVLRAGTVPLTVLDQIIDDWTAALAAH